MIHPTAIVNPEAQLDPSVEIGPWCIVGPHVRIGKGSKLHSHVVIEGRTDIGENNTFFPFSVIGAVPQDLKYKGEPTRLEIGNNNTIRESVTINLGTVQGGGLTKIGDDNLLMAYVHLGHDCIVGNHVILANSVGLSGHVEVDDYANVGGMTGITQFCRIGKYAYVVGKTALEKDVPPYAIAYGSRPAILRGANIVGLRRKGFGAEVIQMINEAMKLWMRTEVEKDQCLLEIESQYGDVQEVRAFIDFIRSSKQGVAR